VRGSRVWRKILGVQQITVDGFSYQGSKEEEVLVVDLHPARASTGPCSRCDRRCRGYDQGGGVRRWRALDLDTQGFPAGFGAEGVLPGARCRCRGAVGQAGARFTRCFEDTCAWLTARTTATVVCELLRITWRSV
jgi:hypothetical protein